MKTLRIGLVLALVATLALLAIPVGLSPTQAQGGTFYDFRTSAHGWTVDSGFHCYSPEGHYVGSTGFVSNDFPSSCEASSHINTVVIQIVLAAPISLATVEIFYSGTAGNCGFAGSTETSLVAGGPSTGEYHSVNCAGAGTATFSFSGSYQYYWLRLISNSTSGDTDFSGATITGVSINGVLPTTTPTPTPTITPTPTPLASGPCSTDWTKTYDFTQQAYGFVNTPSSNNTWTLGTGFASEDLKSDLSGVYLGVGDHLHAAIISRTIYSTTINSGSVTVDYRPGSAGPSIDARDIFVQLNSTTLADGGNPPPAGSSPLTFSGSWTNGTLTITAVDAGLLNEGSSTSMLGSATIKSLTLSGTGYDPDGQCQTGGTGTPGATVWDYPLAQRDTLGGPNYFELNSTLTEPSAPFSVLKNFDTSSTFDSSKIALFAFSQKLGDNVHSMTDGTVSSVVPLDGNSPCAIPLSLGNHSCEFDLTSGAIYQLNDTTAFVVTISTLSANVIYIVDSPEVQPGQLVTAGCILGKTIMFSVVTGTPGLSIFPPGIGVSPGTNQSTNGYTIVQSITTGNVPLDVLPFLQIDPPDKHCGQGNAGGCDLVANAIFAAPNSEWTALNADQPATNPAGQTQGLLLIGGVRQSLNLDPSQSYTITVNAHLINPLSGGGRQRPSLQGSGDDFTVQLGSSTPDTIVVSSVNSQQTVISAATYTPTLSGSQEFDLTVSPTNSSQSNIIVDYVCVSTGSSTPTEPSSCMFVNPDFNDSTGWTAGGGTTFSGGLALMPNTGTLTQSITLNPKDGTHSQDYVLAATARRQGAPSGSAHIDLAYTWHGGSSTALGSYSDQVFKTVSSTFTVSSATTGNIVLTASGSSQVLELDSICITTSDGITPPGYIIPPAISITATCKVCSYSPIGDVNYDLPEVIGWLECSLAQIWECEAKQILMGIWQVLLNILMFLGMMRLWFDYTFFSGSLWVNANLRVLANWLNAQFINLANQLADTIRYGPLSSFQITQGGGSNFFDAIISISNTISNLFNQLGTLITSLRDVLLSFLDKLWSLLTLFITLVAALITLIVTTIITWVNMGINFFGTLLQAILIAFNAPPVVPPGLPFCDTSADMIPANCLPIFYLDNTALADNSMLAAVIPLVEGLVAFATIWWAIGRFRSVLSGSVDEETA